MSGREGCARAGGPRSRMRRGGPSVRWFSSRGGGPVEQARLAAGHAGGAGRPDRLLDPRRAVISVQAGEDRAPDRDRALGRAPAVCQRRSRHLAARGEVRHSSAVDPVTQCEGRWAARLVAPVPDHGQQPGGRVGPEQPAGELEAVDVGGHHPRGGSLRLETAHSPPGGWSRRARRADLQGREGGRVDAGPLHGPGPATPGRPTSNRMPLPPECWPCPARRDQPAGGQGGRPAHTRRAQWGRPAPAAGLRPGSRWVYCSAA